MDTNKNKGKILHIFLKLVGNEELVDNSELNLVIIKAVQICTRNYKFFKYHKRLEKLYYQDFLI